MLTYSINLRGFASYCVCAIQVMGGFIPSTQRYHRRVLTIYYYLNCYMFRSYDRLQAEIYLLGFTGLTMDPSFLEYS
jgi:hypothetical protein